MLKKFICFSIIFIFSISLLNIVHANSILDNFNNTTNNTEASAQDTVNTTIDNTMYSTDADATYTEDLPSDYEEEAATVTTTDYEDETELSISNMINIVLIVVGIVLILLGIAVIIKLK